MAFLSANSSEYRNGLEQGYPLLEARGIEQVFGPVRALDGVAVELRAGEVLSLLGENGSGKSTLLSILSGVRRPTAGQVVVDGRPQSFSSPLAALQHGITLVPQEHDLAPHLSVAENIWLANLPGRVVDRRRLERAARAVLEEVVQLDLDVRRPARELRPDDAMLVSLCRACARRPRVILLDETTASLGAEAVEHFLTAVSRLRDRGAAIAMVTHRLVEHRAVGDRAVILRDGRVVAERRLAEADDDELVRLMVGRELPELLAKRRMAPGRVRLAVRGVRLGPDRTPIDLEVRAGEIVGIGGMAGAGRSRLARIIAGADMPAAGTVEVDGQTTKPGNVTDANRHGIGYVPEDRKTMALLLGMSVRYNISVGLRGRFTRWGFVRKRAERALVERLVSDLQIKTSSIEAPVGTLSGGNQQKVIMARLLGAGSRVLVLDEPTKGIDVGAKAEMFRLIGRAAADGCAVIFISSELPELLGISDRVVVLRRGQAVAELTSDALTEQHVVAAAMGVREEE